MRMTQSPAGCGRGMASPVTSSPLRMAGVDSIIRTTNSRRMADLGNQIILRGETKSRTLGALLDQQAGNTPTAPAVVSGDDRLDYAGLKRRVDDFARALLAVGVRHGDRLALLISNRTEWIVAALAGAGIG